MKYEGRGSFFFMGGGVGRGRQIFAFVGTNGGSKQGAIVRIGASCLPPDKGERVLLIGPEFCECLPIKTGIVIGDNVRQFNV